MSLLVVGTLAFDTVETPYGKRSETLGGSANFLAAAAAYFCDVRMVGVIGADFPEAHLEFYRARGIDTAGVTRLAGSTFRWRGYYDENLNVAHTLETQLNVLEAFDPQLPAAYRDTEYVALGNFDPVLQRKVLEQLTGPRLVALDTMNFWIDGAQTELRRTLALVDLLSVNDAEARQLSGEYNLVKAAKTIQRMGPKVVVVKRGEHGALVFAEDSIFAAPAYPLEVIRDPTGAGDSFAGGLMGYLCHTGRSDSDNLRRGVILGSVLASYAVEDFSLDRLRNLQLEEIRERFTAFESLTHFDANADGLWGSP